MNEVSILSKNELAILIADVRTDGELINLTDLWRAAGSPTYKTTTFWLRQDSVKDLIKEVGKKFKYDLKSYLKIKKGRTGGGTWAHRQIALEYAKYLDPQIAILVNDLFFERIEEERNPDLIGQRYIRTYEKKGKPVEWINERFKGISIRNEFTGTLKKHGVVQNGYRNCTNAIYEPLFGGTTSVVRSKKGLSSKDSIRDNLSSIELAAVGLSELLASDNISRQNAKGSGSCEIICRKSAKEVAKAIINSRNTETSKGF